MSLAQIGTLIAIVVGCITIISFIIAQITIVTTRRKELKDTLAALTERDAKRDAWEKQQADMTSATLSLCFNIANELVEHQGANGSLKKDRDRLRELVCQYATDC